MKFYDWVCQRFMQADDIGTMAFLTMMFVESDNGQSVDGKSKEEVHALLGLNQMMDDEKLQEDFNNLWAEWEQTNEE